MRMPTSCATPRGFKLANDGIDARSLQDLPGASEYPEQPPQLKPTKIVDGFALQQTLQRFSLKDRRYLHGISFRPKCFGARPRTPGWVPVLLDEDRTLWDGVSIVGHLGVCRSEI